MGFAEHFSSEQFMCKSTLLLLHPPLRLISFLLSATQSIIVVKSVAPADTQGHKSSIPTLPMAGLAFPSPKTTPTGNNPSILSSRVITKPTCPVSPPSPEGIAPGSAGGARSLGARMAGILEDRHCIASFGCSIISMHAMLGLVRYSSLLVQRPFECL